MLAAALLAYTALFFWAKKELAQARACAAKLRSKNMYASEMLRSKHLWRLVGACAWVAAIVVAGLFFLPNILGRILLALDNVGAISNIRPTAFFEPIAQISFWNITSLALALVLVVVYGMLLALALKK